MLNSLIPSLSQKIQQATSAVQGATSVVQTVMDVSSAASNISAGNFGYDFVVAVTQKAINAAMMRFLASFREPTVSMCYIADQNGQPMLIDRNAFLKLSQGSDPFKIPDGADPNSNQDLINLRNARFLAGFSAQLGVPPVSQPSLLPPVVTLGSQANAVTFNMLCSTFIIVQLDIGGRTGNYTWRNQSQQRDAPWIFTSKVDMRLSSTNQPTAYDRLREDAKQKIMNVSATAFSMEQLLFDLTNASLMTVPSITGVTPNTVIYTLLQQYFIASYFGQMQAQQQSLLGSNIVVQSPSNSTPTLSSFTFNINPYVDNNGHAFAQPSTDQQQLATLNYLCAEIHDTLQPASTFNWNWVDASELSNRDGTITINRNKFATYLRNLIETQVGPNCMLPTVRVSLSGVFDTNVNYSVQLHGGQKPTVTVPSTGKTVLRYDYQAASRDQAGVGGDMGELNLQNSYSLVVEFHANTVIVTQTTLVHMYARKLQTSGSGNIIDKTVVDSYTLQIDKSGKLGPTYISSGVTDKSNSPSVNSALNFFTDFNSLSDYITNFVKSSAPNDQKGKLTSLIQNYVFPGSKTFFFNNVKFSNNQDLVASVSYA